MRAPQAVAGKVDPMRVVDDAIQDRIGISGIANQLMPFVHHSCPALAAFTRMRRALSRPLACFHADGLKLGELFGTQQKQLRRVVDQEQQVDQPACNAIARGDRAAAQISSYRSSPPYRAVSVRTRGHAWPARTAARKVQSLYGVVRTRHRGAWLAISALNTRRLWRFDCALIDSSHA
jgi:hypothetical protein